MLRLDAITIQLGQRIILDRATCAISDRDRVAIVGRNGAGKSTLLKIAAGVLAKDSGDVVLSRGQTVGYLAQEAIVNPTATLWEEVFAALEPVVALQRKADALLEQAAAMEGDEAGAERMLEEAEVLLERFRQLDGWQAEASCGRVLSGLGFDRDQWHRLSSTFSGGWQVRIALARLLLERPSFLLLDEPTNHLDIETRTWLLQELKGWPGAVVIIGHDRDFLDRLVGRTVEVAGGGLTEYTGGYSDYLGARELRIEQLKKDAVKRDEERAHIQSFIDRFRFKASKAAAVQGRVKRLEKLPRIVVPTLERRAKLEFPEPPPSAEPMIEVREVHKAFGDVKVLESADASVYRQERILLVGPNGAGKSTLLRLLAGVEREDDGTIVLGNGVRAAWFAQDQAAELDPDHTVLQAISEVDPLLNEQKLRSFLGSFLFSGDDVFKRCGVLSGGEKSRVALAKILLRRANLLLLDEPTNHLDIESKEVLAAALKRFGGSILFVSHDRAFADALAEQVWEVGAGKIRPFRGNLDAFLWMRAIELGVVSGRAPGERAPDAWLLGGLPEEAAAEEAASSEPAEGAGKGAWKDRKKQKAEQNRTRKRLRQLPKEIEALEGQIAALQSQMADPALASAWDRLFEIQGECQAAETKLMAAYEEWEELDGAG